MKRLRLNFVLVGLVLCVGIMGCVPVAPTTPAPASSTPIGATSQPRRGGTLVILSGVGSPRHFNPALISGSATAFPAAQIFASPLRYDENWNPQPYLAKSWEVSKDGLAVTLHLVQGATFHDGHPITSEDVAFSVMTVKTYHPFKTMFAPVDKVDTPDPLTAVIRLSRPHPAILLAMSPALLPILPKHIYGDGRDIL
ncbi:MAG: ABC transporter substrate-binding protein, partial [Anaerolineae bacterium]